MKFGAVIRIFLIISLASLTSISWGWDHSIEFGYGNSHDPNHSHYINSGFLLSGDMVPLWKNHWARLSITGSLGHWHTTTPVNRNIGTVAVSLAGRFYPIPMNYMYPPYLLASFGPAYLSSRRFGYNTQGSHLAIQSNLGLGVEVGCFDVNLRLEHFSNANLAKPNEGFNILYLLSVGYLF